MVIAATKDMLNKLTTATTAETTTIAINWYYSTRISFPMSKGNSISQLL